MNKPANQEVGPVSPSCTANATSRVIFNPQSMQYTYIIIIIIIIIIIVIIVTIIFIIIDIIVTIIINRENQLLVPR